MVKSFLTILIASLSLLNTSSSKVIRSANQSEVEQNDLKLDEDKLVFAHVIYRHGARNIKEDTYPNDPYKDVKYWPEGFAQLTNEGKLQQYKLGKYLRRRYHNLLDAKYTPEKVYVQSTDVDRALMSALANLAGLFEPISEEKWHSKIMWQPIPVHTIPQNMDYVLKAEKKCPKYKKAFKKYVKKSEEVQQIYEDNKDLFRQWSEESGAEIKSMKDVHWLYKILFTERFQNKRLPDWAEKAMENNGTLERLAIYYHSMAAATPKLARLKSGFLLKEILERFSHKIDASLKPDRSLWLYSAHETTIANMLNGLGLLEFHIPPYASSLHFELYKTAEDKHYIQLFYRKLNEEYPPTMNIPGCGEKCSLDQLYEIYSKIIPDDFDSECYSKER